MRKKIGMNVNKQTTVLSILAAVCFFVAFILSGETLDFILGCAWVCIFLGQIETGRKRRK